MTQLALTFPAPMTAAQLAAAHELQRLVDERAASYETRRYRERRTAALKHTRLVKAT